MRLIDADALREIWVCLPGHDFEPSSFVYSIDNAPTVEPASPWHRVEDGLPKYGQDVLAARLYGADVDGWAYEIIIAHVCEVRGTNYWNATNITHFAYRFCRYSISQNRCSGGKGVLHSARHCAEGGRMRIKERTEAQEQEALIEWCELNKGRHPELAKILHIPNGGYRTPAEAAHFKRLGVKAGVPDLLLPYPVGDHHGLWIELKSLSGKPSQAQREWILWLRDQGYCAYICRGAEAAIRCIEMYLRCGA